MQRSEGLHDDIATETSSYDGDSNPVLIKPTATHEIDTIPTTTTPKTWRDAFRKLFIFTQYPYAVWFIIGNEFCERYSFYGFKAILSLYLNKYLLFSEDNATACVHAFIFFAYFTPLFGGWLADSVLGNYWTIVSLSIIYSLGQITVSITAIPGVTGDPPHWWGAAIGLFLVGIGTGGIKPCVSSMGADQFQADQVEVIASFFSIFYFTINAGSTLSSFLTPMLRTYAGYAVAFAVPAGLICFATVLFAVGYRGYTHVKPTGIRNNVFLQLFRVMMAAIRNRFNGRHNRPVQHWIDRAQADYSQEIVYDVKCVLRVCKVLIPIMIFWSLFDQHSTRWVFQAARMDRQVGSYNFNADQITTLNPLLVLFLVMLFDRVIYKVVGLFMNPTPMRKISVGLLFTCASFIASAIVEICIVYNPGQVHVAWQIPQYVLLVIGEILVSVTGLEFAYSQAPKYYKGVMQSFYLLTVSMGNIVVFVVALIPIIPSSVALKGAYEFGFFAVLMFLTFIVFLFFARSYKYRKIQGEETTPISNETEADTMLEA